MGTNLVIDADGHCHEPDVGLVKWFFLKNTLIWRLVG